MLIQTILRPNLYLIPPSCGSALQPQGTADASSCARRPSVIPVSSVSE
jgi:hypothetical protein